MGVSQENISYDELLLQLLDSSEFCQYRTCQDNLEIDLYMTLLFFGNQQYPKEKIKEERLILENFLRVLNNLKVKIQLKRRDTEIDNLLKSIIDTYEENNQIIERYNKEKIKIKDLILEKDSKTITNIIDKLTKEKMQIEDNDEKYDEIRKKVYQIYQDNRYYLENDKIYFVSDTQVILEIAVDEFKEIFYYLLDISIYEQIYQKVTPNRLRTIYINNLINSVINKKYDKVISSIILTYIANLENIDYDEIITNYYKIENIKITDLYSLASANSNNLLVDTAKWQNIMIPNSYLFSKLFLMIKNGMYYCKEDEFIFESIGNDFKISINKSDMIKFLKQILMKNKKNNIQT